MTKDIDVSKIDVGWRVQLRIERPGPIPAGEWLTIKTLTAGIASASYKGERWHFSVTERNILAALPPEPVKDPFAVGKWVVCVASHWPARTGDVLQVECEARSNEMFIASSWLLHKAYFRPATPEEIAAHLEKKDMAGKPVIPCDEDPKSLTSEDCELKITPAVSLDADAKGDGKITFTVAGREFFVGQRVYANTRGTAGPGRLIDVPHEVTGCFATAELVCIREMDGFNQRVIAASCLSDAPLHEWQFGDQASHPKHGKVLVIDFTDPKEFLCASPSDPEIFIDPSELTFIRRTDLGE